MASTILTKCGTKAHFAINNLTTRHLMAITNLSSATKLRCCYSTDNSNNNQNGNNSNDNPLTNSQTESKSTTTTSNTANIEIKKSVFISQSYDIFTNLALEDWLYKNFDFSNHHVLMLWSNDPCVVIGRHQNPFLEANVSNLMKAGIPLARRNSGGGTVYHDRGNMNMTFFTPRERYDRNYNLNIITRALFREWGVKAEISTRDDITLQGKKVSGTAAKLGRPNAYHHCTLLVNSDKKHLSEALVKEDVEIVSKATPSVRSPIKNLTDVNRHVNVPQLLSALGYEFMRTSATELNDGGRDLMMKQRGFQLINPTEKWFPGLMEIREKYASWEWCIGKTPKFTVQKQLQLKSDEREHGVKLKVNVAEGIIDDMYLVLPTTEEIQVVSTLKGQQYNEDNLNNVVEALKGVSTDNVKQAMNNSL